MGYQHGDFRVYSSTFEDAVNEASTAELNIKATRYGTRWGFTTFVDKTKPMIHSHIGEEAELQAAKLQRNIQRWYT